MRKYHQKLILELVQSLEEANEEIRNLLFDKKETVMTLLADCQEVAIQIGNLIEELAGEGTKTVSLLEGYCMLLYSASKAAVPDHNDPVTVSDVSDQLRRQISEIIDSIGAEFKTDQLEIAFMPYNATMWDCMESIWLAAKADPQSDVYVVPLPYCSRNSAGKVEKIHYDGDRFPEYVPVIHYDSYDLEARKPDVIYIHNPYDQYNFVTSILPKYYSYELKKHSDMLVYVPYFVCGEKPDPEFFAVSAVTSTDKIIVQSEAVKSAYLKYARKNQVVALGSPKTDKILGAAAGGGDLPAEWKEIIGNKKIVFFNTHIRNLMKGDREFIEKLKNIFRIFEKREDAVLWWRPHPLSEDTCKAMNPDYYREYQTAVEEYQAGRIGIYDETEDMHQGLALSDAYYGDRSSIVYLYDITGKPVLFQNTNIISDVSDKAYREDFLNFAVKDQSIWFVSKNTNCLLCMDIDSNEIKLVAEIPSDQESRRYSINAIVIEGDDIVLTPAFSQDILRYHIPEHQFVHYPLRHKPDKGTKKWKFANAYQYKDNVFMIPREYPAFVKYNLSSGAVIEDKKPCLAVKPHKLIKDEFYFYRGSRITEEILMLPVYGSNMVMKYDMSSGEHQVFHIGEKSNRYMHVAFDGTDYWLFQAKGNVIKWQEADGQSEEYNCFPAGFRHGKEFDFIDLVLYEDMIFLFPSHANMILKIKPKSGTISCFREIVRKNEVREEKEEKEEKESPLLYISAKLIDGFIYAISSYDKELHKIDPVTGELVRIPLVLPKICEASWQGMIFDRPADQDKPFHYTESQEITLDRFLDFMQSGERRIAAKYIDKLFVNADGSCGQKVHDYIKNTVLQIKI